MLSEEEKKTRPALKALSSPKGVLFLGLVAYYLVA